MKKIITLSAILICFLSFAQVPQGISYQAIALDASGNPVVSSNVGVRLSVLDNSATGTNLYTETQTKTTNAQGLFNLVIGQGTATIGTFSTINWATNSKFLKVEMDVTGGTNYVLVGNTQLLSVPYSLYADKVGSLAGNPSINDDIINNKTSNFAFDDTVANKVYAYNTYSGTWSFQAYNITANPTLMSSNGNFSFDDTVDNKVYIYNGKTGIWSSQAYNITANPTTQQSNGTFIFDDTVANKMYVYNVTTGTWSSQAYNITANPSIVISNINIGFNDTVDNKVYVYNGKTGIWSSQSYNITANPTLQQSNGNFMFDDTVDNKMYIYSASTNTWSSQAYNITANPTIVISTTN